ncbi:MAG: chorismate mutase [Deltaproteobacteria bacterium]|nr:chorismate mutase [Deltaproteobacteria bacterium]
MITTIHIESALDLNRIAAYLEGLEETIIYKLIDRAQFAENRIAYQIGKSGFQGAGELSLLDLRLRRQEEMDVEFGRFCVPEERPFNDGLPNPKRDVTLPPSCLNIDNYDAVNVSTRIREAYCAFLPDICPAGDDGQYGSSVENDVYALQAIARRIHFGALYVAESKYRSDPNSYAELVRQRDREALLRLLTRPEVEAAILKRVAEKVTHIQSYINPEVRRSIPPEAVLNFYRTQIIPLTKEGQVRYFLSRKMSIFPPRI